MSAAIKHLTNLYKNNYNQYLKIATDASRGDEEQAKDIIQKVFLYFLSTKEESSFNEEQWHCCLIKYIRLGSWQENKSKSKRKENNNKLQVEDRTQYNRYYIDHYPLSKNIFNKINDLPKESKDIILLMSLGFKKKEIPENKSITKYHLKRLDGWICDSKACLCCSQSRSQRM